MLHAHFIGALIVNSFYLDLTFITLAMLVVGGMRSLTGAVVGVVILSTLIELLRQLEGGVDVAGTALSIPLGGQEIGLADRDAADPAVSPGRADAEPGGPVAVARLHL